VCSRYSERAGREGEREDRQTGRQAGRQAGKKQQRIQKFKKEAWPCGYGFCHMSNDLGRTVRMLLDRGREEERKGEIAKADKEGFSSPSLSSNPDKDEVEEVNIIVSSLSVSIDEDDDNKRLLSFLLRPANACSSCARPARLSRSSAGTCPE